MNIEKHAQATKTSIDLAIMDNWLTLTIRDNGIGMYEMNENEPSLHSGIGTRNLAERVKYHRGQFKLTSSRKGTTVVAKIPRSAFAHHYTQKQEPILAESI
jgi:two-component system NarL family sensor kinase